MIEASPGAPTSQQPAGNGAAPPPRPVITSIQRLPAQSSQIKKQTTQRTTSKPPLSTAQSRGKKSNSPIKVGVSTQSNITLLQSGVIQWGSWLRHTTGKSDTREEPAAAESKGEQRKVLPQMQGSIQAQLSTQSQSQNPPQVPNQSHNQTQNQSQPQNQHTSQSNQQYSQSYPQFPMNASKDVDGAQEGNYTSYTNSVDDQGKAQGRIRPQELAGGYHIVRDAFPTIGTPAMMVQGHYPPMFDGHAYIGYMGTEIPNLSMDPGYHYRPATDRQIIGGNDSLSRPLSNRIRSGSVSESVNTAIEYGDPMSVLPPLLRPMTSLNDATQNMMYSSSSSLHDAQKNSSAPQVHPIQEFPFDFNLEMDEPNLASTIAEQSSVLYPRNDIYMDRSSYREAARQPYVSDENNSIKLPFYQVGYPNSAQFDQYASQSQINDDRRVREDRADAETLHRSNSTSSLDSSSRTAGFVLQKDVPPSSDSLHSSGDLSDVPIS